MASRDQQHPGEWTTQERENNNQILLTKPPKSPERQPLLNPEYATSGTGGQDSISMEPALNQGGQPEPKLSCWGNVWGCLKNNLCLVITVLVICALMTT